MYDELVKRMRKCATEAGACKTCELDSNPSCTDVLMEQAADAIEELVGFVQEAERDRDEYRERLDKANDVIEELSKPKWIPVEERRAEIPCICCDANGNMPFIPQGIVTIKDDQGVWQIDAHLADLNLHQNRLKPVLGYQNRITYWMPLPEPPKEE